MAMAGPEIHGFFKPFVAHHSSQTLEIPRSYAKHIKLETPQYVYLMGPSGRNWPVRLVRGDNHRLYLQQGWPEFVKCHSLENMDILVFTYDGEVDFMVEIFDGSSSMRRGVFDANCGEGLNDSREPERNNRVEAIAAAPSVNVCEDAQNVAQFPSQGTHDGAETEKHRAADSRTEDRLSFVKPMRDYNVGRSFLLAVPAWFVTEHFPRNKKKIEIILQNKEGKEWPVILNYNSRALHGGWPAFVRDNHIKEGDTCTFELVHKLKMLVHISKQQAPPQLRQVKRLATPEEPQAFGAEKKRRVSRYRASIADPSSIGLIKNDTKQDHTSEGAQKVAQVPSQGHTKSGAGKQRSAESRANDCPSFVVPMRKCNIRSSIVNVKSVYFSDHWSSYGKKTQIVLQNQEGRQWSVKLCRYRKRGHLSGGWLCFVRDNHIKEKDICTFKIVSAREIHVHISRHSARSQMREGSEGHDVVSEDQVGACFGVNKSSEEDVVARQVEAATARVIEELQEQKVKTEKATEEIAELREQNRRIMEILDALKKSGAS